MPFPAWKAWGFRDIDKYQNEIFDGVIKKKWVGPRSRVNKIRDFHEHKNFW